MALHPTQLYDAGAELLILVLLLATERGGGTPGWTFWVYILLYAVSRFVIEFFRGDPRGATMGFSTSQLISLALVPLAFVMLVRAVANAARGRAGCRSRAARAADAAGRSTAADAHEAMDHHDLLVSAEQAGIRLDQFLVAQLPGQSRSQIQRLIKDGRVQVGGREAKANYVIRAGDAIGIDVPAPVAALPEPEALPLDVLFEDADIIVVNKAAGMVVHPAPGHGGGTLVNALLHHVDDLSGVGGELRPGIVHRLDRGTSGVMVVAKHDAAHREMARQFHDREVEKEYVALVWGLVHQGRRIDAAIGRDPNDRKKMSTRAQARAVGGDAHHVLAVPATACRTCTWRSPPAGRTRSACT